MAASGVYGLVLNYLPDAPASYYRLASLVVGKPGTMTITESVVSGRPLITLKSRGMAPVQRGNEAWLLEHGLGLVVEPAGLGPAVRCVLSDDDRYHRRAIEQASRGVFEAAEIVASLAADG